MRATGISASGRTVVGWGTNPQGQSEGFVARLPVPIAPVPGLAWPALVLLAAALTVAARSAGLGTGRVG